MKLNSYNYNTHFLSFRDRQAGVTAIYNPESDLFTYNAYCIEAKLLKEIFTAEYHFLEEALEVINSEFTSWELTSFANKDCSSCGNK